ncbi:DUF1707 SHOCT-like domain-containing protein [Amycolatopsis sp. CA-126428]|uniref:DUF1707 SHOCT-like domain-containing protein n=1 Tax=Amycolatopsis sp. CA-126428 TaxID=2073158 RepID=UPI000CD217DE|nr:DUF1707 domain-containing protein [Amycolatopsis sp. CA-126428]
MNEPAIRCSDAEREQTRSRLYTAAGEGRLSMAEVEERLATLETTRYRHELGALIADLPAESPEAHDGWRPILGAVRRQLTADIATLLNRSSAPDARRRVVIAVALLAALLMSAMVLVAAFHGFGGEGFEHHELGHD